MSKWRWRREDGPDMETVSGQVRAHPWKYALLWFLEGLHWVSSCMSEGPEEGPCWEGPCVVPLGPGHGDPRVVERIQGGRRGGESRPQPSPEPTRGAPGRNLARTIWRHLGVICSVCQNRCTSQMFLLSPAFCLLPSLSSDAYQELSASHVAAASFVFI